MVDGCQQGNVLLMKYHQPKTKCDLLLYVGQYSRLFKHYSYMSLEFGKFACRIEIHGQGQEARQVSFSKH